MKAQTTASDRMLYKLDVGLHVTVKQPVSHNNPNHHSSVVMQINVKDTISMM